MHFNTLKSVRQQMYDSFERSAGALFNLCDALLSESQAQSLAELSLSPFFARQWREPCMKRCKTGRSTKRRCARCGRTPCSRGEKA